MPWGLMPLPDCLWNWGIWQQTLLSRPLLSPVPARPPPHVAVAFLPEATRWRQRPTQGAGSHLQSGGELGALPGVWEGLRRPS